MFLDFGIDNVRHIKVILASILSSLATADINKNNSKNTQKFINIAIIIFGLIAFFSYWRFGQWHYNDQKAHRHEIFHNYLCVKYNNELGYYGIYPAVFLADWENNKKISKVDGIHFEKEHRNMKPEEIIKRRFEFKKNFSNKRWYMFKKDVAKLKKLFDNKKWETNLLRDHGINSPPVWFILGKPIISWTNMSVEQALKILPLIDTFLVFGIFAMIYWAFGWKAAIITMSIWGLDPIRNFDYNGGSFLRYDWIFMIFASLALMKKEKMFLSGFFVTYASLIRIFPIAFAFGVGIRIIYQLIKTKKIKKKYLKFIFGGIFAFIVLIPLSIIIYGKSNVYAEHFNKIKNHSTVIATNHAGVKNLFYYDKDASLKFKSIGEWRQKVNETLNIKKIQIFGTILLFVMILSIAFIKAKEDWEAFILGATLIPIVGYMANYYYAIMPIMALLFIRKAWIAPVFYLLTIIISISYDFSKYADEIYYIFSCGFIAFAAAIVISYALEGIKKADIIKYKTEIIVSLLVLFLCVINSMTHVKYQEINKKIEKTIK